MTETFINLPEPIEQRIQTILKEEGSLLASPAKNLHERYSTREKGKENTYLTNYADALAYTALRFPATYAQISSSLLQVQEVLPIWQPKNILDIGSGPATGTLAAKNIWPEITHATCVDINSDLVHLGGKITDNLDESLTIQWRKRDITENIGENTDYDLVIIANVLNELDNDDAEMILENAYKICRGVLLIIEPGTSYGHTLMQTLAKKCSTLPGQIIAPFVSNSYVTSKDYWIHFSQRFIRPAFQRSLRQSMRDSLHMASDWEEAKYTFVAVSKLEPESPSWGRCVGPVIKEKGFLTVPVLTKDSVIKLKVMKRHKAQYNFAREVKWGELIHKEEDIVSEARQVSLTEDSTPQ